MSYDDRWLRVVAEDPEPAGRERARRVAASLMRLPLPLLDRAGESSAAARIQHAIDDADGKVAEASSRRPVRELF